MANINQIGIPGLETGFLQPKRQNLWRISFIGTGSTSQTEPTPLSMQAVSVTRPKQTFDTIDIGRFNSRAQVAGKHTWEPITIVVEDDIKSTASKIIRNQLDKQMHYTGASGAFLKRDFSGSPYMFAMDILQLDGNQKALEQWALEGCWFSNVDWGENDYNTSDTVKISITVNYAHAAQIFHKVTGSDKAEGHYVFALDGLFNSQPAQSNGRREAERPIDQGQVVQVNEPAPALSQFTQDNLIADANNFILLTNTVTGEVETISPVELERRERAGLIDPGIYLTESKPLSQLVTKSPEEWTNDIVHPSTGEVLSITNPPSPEQAVILDELGMDTEVDPVTGLQTLIDKDG